jgi:hypothetical protein
VSGNRYLAFCGNHSFAFLYNLPHAFCHLKKLVLVLVVKCLYHDTTSITFKYVAWWHQHTYILVQLQQHPVPELSSSFKAEALIAVPPSLQPLAITILLPVFMN